MKKTGHHGDQELSGQAAYCRPGHNIEEPAEGRFGRMFPHLAPNYVPPAVLAEAGRDGGEMDGGTTSNPTATVPVGQVIFGQFIDHDITLDVSSSLNGNADLEAIENLRTPTLDLDCVYGLGPEDQPYMYDSPKLLIGADTPGATVEQRNDLYRAPNDAALIGDHRNDENRIISQMQLGMIKFHNLLCDDPALGNGHFETARQAVTWHYQWSVVFDFLPAMCGRPVVDDVLAGGRKYYCPTRPFIPVEFSVAAYRFGHSMVPHNINIQKGKPARAFFGPTLGKGFEPLPSVDAIADWNELFVTDEGREVQMAERFDTKMASVLLNLPFFDSGERSLATRNLLRGNAFRLPSGEAVAEKMGIDGGQIKAVSQRVAEVTGQELVGSPLWLYLLAEGEVIGRESAAGGFDPGEGLGPVGARIVAEVLIGLLELDPHSFLGVNRNWVPDPRFDTIGKILASTNSTDLP